jgi:hypothetical protein
MTMHRTSCRAILPLIPAQAGIQKRLAATFAILGPRFRGDERIVQP